MDQAMTILKDTYAAIDIRGILAKKKDGSDWIAAFLKIRFTKESQAAVQEIHKNILDNLGSILYDNFQVVLYSKSMLDLDLIKRQLEKGHLTFSGTTFSLPETDFQNITKKTLTRLNEPYTTEAERSGYSHRLIFSSISCSISELIGRLDLTEEDCGGSLSRTKYWLDTHDLDDGNNNNVVIIFPIFCKKVKNPPGQRGQTMATYEIHKLLLTGCSGEIFKMPSDEYKNFNPQNYSNDLDDMKIISVPLSLTPISPDDDVRIDMRHDRLGVLTSDSIETDEILASPFRVDPLLDAFLSVTVKDKLKEYILSSIPTRQEQATSWLLGLLGFRNVYLKQFEKQDQQLLSAPEYSVDILVQYSIETLMAIDCITDIPDTKDITMAKNAADLIGDTISKRVIPGIFSSQPCGESLKYEAAASGVFIVGRIDIDSLCGMLLTGHTDKARTLFANLVSSRETTDYLV